MPDRNGVRRSLRPCGPKFGRRQKVTKETKILRREETRCSPVLGVSLHSPGEYPDLGTSYPTRSHFVLFVTFCRFQLRFSGWMQTRDEHRAVGEASRSCARIFPRPAGFWRSSLDARLSPASSGWREAEPYGAAHQLGPARAAELLRQSCPIGIDRLHAHAQLRGDLLVAEPVGQAFEDGALPHG